MTYDRPRQVVPDEATRALVVDELIAAGWTVHNALAPPDEPFDLGGARIVCSGTVDDGQDVEDALLAAARGAAVVVVDALADPLAGEEFAAALAGFDTAPAGESDDVRLDAVTGRLLDTLANGTSIPAAARAAHLSLRTANRRLAQARAFYGVATTHAAVLAHVRRPP